MTILLYIIAVLLCTQIALFVWMLKLIMVHKRILVPLADYDKMVSYLQAKFEREKAAFMRKMISRDG